MDVFSVLDLVLIGVFALSLLYFEIVGISQSKRSNPE